MEGASHSVSHSEVTRPKSIHAITIRTNASVGRATSARSKWRVTMCPERRVTTTSTSFVPGARAERAALLTDRPGRALRE